MALPANLQHLIEISLDAVRAHPQHDLNLGYRQAIWAALGPYAPDPETGADPGRERRGRLAVLTARHVLPIWKAQFPADDTPERVLTQADNILSGKVDLEQEDDLFDQYWSYFYDLGYENDSMALFAGFAAAMALSTASGDEIYDPDNIRFETIDDEHIEENDCSFFAAAAYANGPIFKLRVNPTSDPAKRQEFWEWWLTKAVPEAWEAEAEGGDGDSAQTEGDG